jgi:dTDP-4-amino-4,6-dideoxygalactose transaminase
MQLLDGEELQGFDTDMAAYLGVGYVRGVASGTDALRLAVRDVETGIHYPVPIHRQTAWRETFGDHAALPCAEVIAGEILSLPVHPDLADVEVERVADTVARFFD